MTFTIKPFHNKSRGTILKGSIKIKTLDLLVTTVLINKRLISRTKIDKNILSVNILSRTLILGKKDKVYTIKNIKGEKDFISYI